MRGLYLDCFSGISGDMFLGVLVDLGVDIGYLRTELRKLSVRGFQIRAKRVTRGGLAGTKVDVRLTSRRQPERGIRDILSIVQDSPLSAAVRDKAAQTFEILARAEARVHRVPVNRVHLHEVGAVDAIVDIVGAMIGMEKLGWPRVVCSSLHLGRGMVTMEHGTFPVPPPAVAEILRGRPTYATHVEGELVTPTGAALAVTMATEFGPMPSMRIQEIGYGAGSREYDGHPNLLRAIYGELLSSAAIRETVVVIETTIDDMNPQLYGHLMECLFAAGAYEVFYTPIQMKKNRPGIMVTVICPEPQLEAVSAVIFRETTTIGFRYLPMGRIELNRTIETVRTPYGPVRVKVSFHDGEAVQNTPEYDDCRRAALKSRVSLREVQRAAVSALMARRDELKRNAGKVRAVPRRRRAKISGAPKRRR